MLKACTALVITLLSSQAMAQTVVGGEDSILTKGTRSIYIPAYRTFFGGEYKPAEQNLAMLRELKPKVAPFKLADFTADDPDMATLVCRLSWPVHAPAELPYTLFLTGAMRNELSQEGLYAEDKGIEVTGRLDHFNFVSMGSPKWSITATFTVAGKEPVTITHETAFDSGWTAASACNAVNEKMVPAMQEFLLAVYSDPKFQALLQ